MINLWAICGHLCSAKRFQKCQLFITNTLGNRHRFLGAFEPLAVEGGVLAWQQRIDSVDFGYCQHR